MVNVQKDTCFGLSLTLCTIFKICSQFLKIAIFEKFRFFKNAIFLNIFHYGAPSCSHANNDFVGNLVNDKKIL